MSLQEKHFQDILEELCIPATTVMEVSKARCCNEESLVSKVAILVAHLSHGLRLPFYHPLRNILDLLGLVLAQLHPFALRAYLDLTAQKFLAFYSVRGASKGSVANFSKKEKGQILAQFEPWYSNAKAWTTKFFFINGEGWEFPATKEVRRHFLVREICSPIPHDKSLWATMAPLSC